MLTLTYIDNNDTTRETRTCTRKHRRQCGYKMHTGKHLSQHSGRKAHTRTFSPQMTERMDGATGVVVNNPHMHTPLPPSLSPSPSCTHQGPAFLSSSSLFKAPCLLPSFALPWHCQTSRLTLNNVSSRCIFCLSFYPHPLSPLFAFHHLLTPPPPHCN